MNNVTLKWVVAHEPIDLFLRTAEAFKKEVFEMSKGKINIEIMTKNEWEERNPENFPLKLSKINDTVNYDMTQFTTTVAGMFEKNFRVFDMPFLFKDHDHVSRVVDGKIGKNLLSHMSKNTNYQGLAFTYSGGFRTMVSKTPIKSLKDLEGMNFSCSSSEIIADTYKLLNVNAIRTVSDDDANILKNIEDHPEINFDGGETTIVRYEPVKEFAPYITDTQHSIFMTTIVIGTKIWSALSEEDKEIVILAAKNAAKTEREKTIADTEKFKNESDKHCAGFFEFDESETELFKQTVNKIYNKDYVNKHFSPNLVKQILNS